MMPAMVATEAVRPRVAPADRALALAAVQRWFLRAGLFLLPIAYAWNTYDGYVLPKLLLARVLLFGMLALFLLRYAVEGSITLRRSALDLPILAFLASAALSTVLAYNVNVAVFGTYSRYDGLLTSLTYAGLFWLSLQTLDSKAESRALLRVMLASGYAAAVLAIGQSMSDSVQLGALAPAFGTLGQKQALGAFLALLLPLAAWELIAARGWPGRILALNAIVVMVLALVLSFSRSAWVAAAVAVLVVALALYRNPRARIAIIALALLTVVVGGTAILTSGVALQRTDLLQLGDRPVVWSDTLRLIASRPLAGYGPDNFGLVYPSFQSIYLQAPWDKAHEEVLQIAATQGLIGVAAYLWFLLAFARAFWSGHRDAAAWAVLAALAGYEATLLLNFTVPAAAFPFWIFLAGALVTVGGTRETKSIVVRAPRLAMAAAALSVAVCALATVPAYFADVDLRAAVVDDFSGQSAAAMAPAQAAASLAPYESVYATEMGNIAFERNDWQAARLAYKIAADLGTFNPAVYRNLALSDQHLGLFAEGLAAAQRAYQLDRFDPANRALLLDFGGTP